MFKNVQEEEAISKIRFTSVPPSPDKAYRLRLRIALQTYRNVQRRGWTKIVKSDLLPLIDGDTLKQHSDLFNADTLKQRLSYWNERDGDISDPRLLYAVEAMLNHCAPDLMSGFNSKAKLLSIGAAIASFINLPEKARRQYLASEDYGSRQSLVSRIVPGVYSVLRNELSIRRRPREFLALTNIGSDEFFTWQHMHVRWLSPHSVDVSTLDSAVGFVLPYARTPCVMLRRQHSFEIELTAIDFFADVALPKKSDVDSSYYFSIFRTSGNFEDELYRKHVCRTDAFEAEYNKIQEVAESLLSEV